MAYSYNENYLSDTQKNLGFFFQFALRDLKIRPQSVQAAFLNSEIPHQIEIGNPNFLCGKSGLELAENIFGKEKISEKLSVATKELFYPTAEYWCGFVLAYCQWKNNLTFQKILDNYPLPLLLDSYHLLHEADVSKIEEVILTAIGEN